MILYNSASIIKVTILLVLLCSKWIQWSHIWWGLRQPRSLILYLLTSTMTISKVIIIVIVVVIIVFIFSFFLITSFSTASTTTVCYLITATRIVSLLRITLIIPASNKWLNLWILLLLLLLLKLMLLHLRHRTLVLRR